MNLVLTNTPLIVLSMFSLLCILKFYKQLITLGIQLQFMMILYSFYTALI
jgi:hypothetical protein